MAEDDPDERRRARAEANARAVATLLRLPEGAARSLCLMLEEHERRRRLRWLRLLSVARDDVRAARAGDELTAAVLELEGEEDEGGSLRLGEVRG